MHVVYAEKLKGVEGKCDCRSGEPRVLEIERDQPPSWVSFRAPSLG